MKKILTAIVCCMALCIFSGCITVPVGAEKIAASPEEIVSIEVYYFEDAIYREDGQWMKYSYQDGEEIRTSYEAEPIASVKQEDYAQFIADYEELPFTMTFIIFAAMDPSWYYMGYVVKVTTEDTYYLYTSQAGGSMAYCKDEIWEEFLKKYIGEEPFQIVKENK